MSLDKKFKRYTGFIPPRFKSVDKCKTRQEKIERYNKNHIAAEEWRRKKFVKYSPKKLMYEHLYNMKALYISPEDYVLFSYLHPDDQKKYAPSVDNSLKKGECAVDEDNFFIKQGLVDTDEMFDEEMKLMWEDELNWDFTTKTEC